MKQKYWIYQFENFDFNAFVKKYRELCARTQIVCEHIEPYIDISFLYPDDKELEERERKMKDEVMKSQIETINVVPRKALISDDKIVCKCAYVMHTVIYRTSSSKTAQAAISSQILKQVIGKDYRAILDTMIEMNYIEKVSFLNSPQYLPQEYSTYYTLARDIKIERIYIVNRKIIQYVEKTKKLFKEYYKANEKRLEKMYGRTFKNYYIKSLNSFKIENEEGFDNFVNMQDKSQSEINYYAYIKEYLKNERYEIYNIDKSNRIYHIFSNLKRELKSYINIKFSIDAHNSHPLLFNYFIFYNYDINAIQSYRIFNYMKTIDIDIDNVATDSRYVGKKLHKILIDNNIENDAVMKLHTDELEYMYMTSKGILWDFFNQLHPDINRVEVKTQMFKEVFYSNTKKIVWKEFAKEFKNKYPHVYKIIERWKEPEKDKCIMEYLRKNDIKLKKMSSSLPISMMSLESSIFTDILMSLYKKKIFSIHIHDAIVLPNIENNKNIVVSDVENVMKETFEKFGLLPTFSIDKYD